MVSWPASARCYMVIEFSVLKNDFVFCHTGPGLDVELLHPILFHLLALTRGEGSLGALSTGQVTFNL